MKNNVCPFCEEEKNGTCSLIGKDRTVFETSNLDEECKPDGYNIGFNCGTAAGQSVMHVHMHIIPRYKGDIENPRGGIRAVIPAKKDY